jgi:hypothetical protein
MEKQRNGNVEREGLKYVGKTIAKCLALLIIISGGHLVGSYFRNYNVEAQKKAKMLYQIGDINGDGLEDIVNGNGDVLLRKEDGGYLSLEEVRNKEIVYAREKYLEEVAGIERVYEEIWNNAKSVKGGSE